MSTLGWREIIAQYITHQKLTGTDLNPVSMISLAMLFDPPHSRNYNTKIWEAGRTINLKRYKLGMKAIIFRIFIREWL